MAWNPVNAGEGAKRAKGSDAFFFFARLAKNTFRDSARSGLDLWEGNVHSIKIEIYRKIKLAVISLKFLS